MDFFFFQEFYQNFFSDSLYSNPPAASLFTRSSLLTFKSSHKSSNELYWSRSFMFTKLNSMVVSWGNDSIIFFFYYGAKVRLICHKLFYELMFFVVDDTEFSFDFFCIVV